MENNGTIILVEDDQDDVQIISDIIKELFSRHNLKSFTTLEEVYKYLSKEADKPFIIICDNNWRNKNQEKLKQFPAKYPNLKLKSIPFIFYAASPEDLQVKEAFEELNVQGYFHKGNNLDEIRKDMSSIINYWERSFVPKALVENELNPEDDVFIDLNPTIDA